MNLVDVIFSYLPLVFSGLFPTFASYVNIVFSQKYTLEFASSFLIPATKDDTFISVRKLVMDSAI